MSPLLLLWYYRRPGSIWERKKPTSFGRYCERRLDWTRFARRATLGRASQTFWLKRAKTNWATRFKCLMLESTVPRNSREFCVLRFLVIERALKSIRSILAQLLHSVIPRLSLIFRKLAAYAKFKRTVLNCEPCQIWHSVPSAFRFPSSALATLRSLCKQSSNFPNTRCIQTRMHFQLASKIPFSVCTIALTRNSG